MKKKVLGLLLAACMAVPITAMTMGTITVSAEENVEAAESLAVSADVDEEEPLVGGQVDGFYYADDCYIDGKWKIKITKYYGDSADVVIPDTLDGYTVNRIESSAFSNMDTITSVTIPVTVSTIGTCAFEDCDRLTKVVLPEGLKEIPYECFFGCDNLIDVNIPSTVTTIGWNAFEGCYGLTDITFPSSLIYMKGAAFKNCYDLKEISLPDKLLEIGSEAFSNIAIEELTIPANVTTVGEKAFYNCSGLKNLTIEEGVITIGSYAFAECSALTEISVPKSVTSIGSNAFVNCTDLDSIIILNKNCTLGSNFVGEDVIIYGLEGSTAQKYAETYGNTFYTLDKKVIRDNIKSFVRRMYTNVLGRDADKEGLTTWTTGLFNHIYQGVDIAYGFMMSSEFQNKAMTNSEYLDILYNTFFGRAADETGMNTWLSLMGEGKSKAYVLSGFVNSKEFSELCTSFGIERGTMNDDGTVAKEGVEGFVDRLYSKVMGRTADASGIQMWIGQITSGKMSAEEVAKSFFNSKEYINKNASNEQFLLTLYETFMGRSADEAGKNMWLEQLNSRSMTRTEVLEGFSRSNEFKAILAGYGL